MEVVPDGGGKKTQGRRKIEIKEIQNKSSRQVTFSKRRNGLFRKASELCVLCDVQVAVIAFSPADKVFTFGRPSVDAVIDGYLNRDRVREGRENEASMKDMEICRLREEYEKASEKLREAKERAAMLDESLEAGRFWWEEDIGGMELEELEYYKKGIQQLMADVAARITKATETEMALVDSGSTPHGSGCSTGFMDDASELAVATRSCSSSSQTLAPTSRFLI